MNFEITITPHERYADTWIWVLSWNDGADKLVGEVNGAREFAKEVAEREARAVARGWTPEQPTDATTYGFNAATGERT
ncbi:hypothetical protein [Streptomyces chartreusis]